MFVLQRLTAASTCGRCSSAGSQCDRTPSWGTPGRPSARPCWWAPRRGPWRRSRTRRGWSPTARSAPSGPSASAAGGARCRLSCTPCTQPTHQGACHQLTTNCIWRPESWRIVVAWSSNSRCIPSSSVPHTSGISPKPQGDCSSTRCGAWWGWPGARGTSRGRRSWARGTCGWGCWGACRRRPCCASRRAASCRRHCVGPCLARSSGCPGCLHWLLGWRLRQIRTSRRFHQ